MYSTRKARAISPAQAACAFAGFLALSIAIGPSLRTTFGPHGQRNDFLVFYSGARLLPSGELYQRDKILTLETSLGMTDPIPSVYIRLPFYAALYRPLAALDYSRAYALYEAAALLAFALAAAFWRQYGPGLCLAVAACSASAYIALMHGQDTGFVFLIASVSAWLLRRGKDLAAGSVLALALIKWHFLLPFALLILARKAFRFASGFAGGAAALLAWSFWLCPTWPKQYYLALMQSETTLHRFSMPNLRSLLAGLPGDTWLFAAGAVCLAALCWRAFRIRTAEESLAIALLAGLALSLHAYAYDCMLALPAILLAASPYRGRPALQVAGASFLAFCPILLWYPSARLVPQIALVALLVWLCTGPGVSKAASEQNAFSNGAILPC